MASRFDLPKCQATRLATALPPPAANAPIFYIGRFLMSNATHGKPTAQFRPTAQFPLSSPLGEVFARNANLWFKTHAELLANIDALTHAWLTRRREGIDAMREAIQQMTECQDAAEMLGIQQEWLSGALRRTSEDISSLNDGIASMTQKATAEFEQAAREAAEPLLPAGADMLKAAGDKPRKATAA
jgi:hypothetical protein